MLRPRRSGCWNEWTSVFWNAVCLVARLKGCRGHGNARAKVQHMPLIYKHLQQMRHVQTRRPTHLTMRCESNNAPRNDTQLHAAFSKRVNVPGRHARHATVATPDLCTQPHAYPRSSHAAQRTPKSFPQSQRQTFVRSPNASPKSARIASARHDTCTL